MARIEKYSTGIVGVIKHSIREFDDGICRTNEDIDLERTKENYSLIRRGETAKEIENYRKEIENEIFHYKRKNIVHANEVVCTMPKDCPPEQEQAFMEESFKYICSTLPMGERCVFLAEVHKDEKECGQPHLHVMYVPAVKDPKHEDYEYKLCSDELTKRAVLKQWHPNYQRWLDDAGVHATVANGATEGRGISVKALKEITQETGLTLSEIKELDKENKILKEHVQHQDVKIDLLHTEIQTKDSLIIQAESKDISVENEISELKEKLSEKEHHYQQLKSKANELLAEKTTELETVHDALSKKEQTIIELSSEKENLQQQFEKLQEAYKQQSIELTQSKEKIQELETKVQTQSVQKTWGADPSWGTHSGWGSKENTHEVEEEKIW